LVRSQTGISEVVPAKKWRGGALRRSALRDDHRDRQRDHHPDVIHDTTLYHREFG
jgi:hypothetical protein